MDRDTHIRWNRNLMNDEILCLEQHRDLVQEIKRIPHLPLELPIDMKSLREEAARIQSWQPHELHANKNLPEWYYEHHRKSFRGQCLVDYTPHGDRGMLDVEGYLFQEQDAVPDEHGRLKFFDTQWGQMMPQTLKTLRQVSPYLNRTRIIRTPPAGGIYWHSHHNGIYKNKYLRLASVILTLESNEKCIHGVRDYRDDKSEAHTLHYEPGVPYLFNTWHNHDFWNHGTTDRLTLICYLNFPDNELLRFLAPQVARYKGPRLNID